MRNSMTFAPGRLAAIVSIALAFCAPAHASSILADYFAVSNFATGAPLKCDSVIPYRKYDWGRYQVRDSVLSCDGRMVVETFHNKAPFTGAFDAAAGDGGQIYAYDGSSIRITATQDGGTPGMQYFVGRQYGGDGWLAYWDGVPWGGCATRTAQISMARNPEDRPALHGAETTVCHSMVWWPFIFGGQAPAWYQAATIVSLHCDGSACERQMFVRGWGIVRWDAWAPKTPTVDLSARCPAAWTPTAFGGPPKTGYQMTDCRMFTDIQLTPGADWSVSKYGWPQIGAAIWP